ncbi:MAG TPA: class I lanthipeptide [Thermoanaerobaculia bacterium]|nr:class I lanthipeptide [Thermoanaerobaculia bacterium]
MKKNLPRKLTLNRETLHQLDEAGLQVAAGAELTGTGTGPYTLQLNCRSLPITVCECTGTGPTV